MKRWLVSAFAPFGGATTNSSLTTLEALRHLDWRDQVEFTPPLPVSFRDAWTTLQRELRNDFAGVLILGQAERRTTVTPERLALNWIDARIPDNDGAQPTGQRIIASGPEVLWSNIAWDKMPLPEGCELSYSAGVFVCNQLLFQLMDWANRNSKLGGFVHIPLLSSQSDPAFESLPKMADKTAAKIVAKLLMQLVES